MKKVIQTDKAPKAIGLYSQGIQAGNLLFLSGQIALDPKTGEMVAGDVRQQTQQVLENIKGLLESQGLEMRVGIFPFYVSSSFLASVSLYCSCPKSLGI